MAADESACKVIAFEDGQLVFWDTAVSPTAYLAAEDPLDVHDWA